VRLCFPPATNSRCFGCSVPGEYCRDARLSVVRLPLVGVMLCVLGAWIFVRFEHHLCTGRSVNHRLYMYVRALCVILALPCLHYLHTTLFYALVPVVGASSCCFSAAGGDGRSGEVGVVGAVTSGGI